MLVLSTLTRLLSQILSPPRIHTAILLTPNGDLVSFVSNEARPKDEIRVLVGLSGEVWMETKDDGLGMLDSELGRVLVFPVTLADAPTTSEPLLLIAINAFDTVQWDELQLKARTLANHLAKPVRQLEESLAVSPTFVTPRVENSTR